MKRSSVFNIFLIALFIVGCSSNENTSAYCPEDGCLLERNNPNERFKEETNEELIPLIPKRNNPNDRFSNTNEKLVDTDFEAMEVSNDFPYPPKAETFIKEGEIPRPKKIFSSQGSENVEVRRLGEIYWIYLEALPSKSWPLIKDYLAYRNYDLSKEEPSEGKIEAKNVDNEFVELTLEHGIKNNSSEVYLLDESNQSKAQELFEDMAEYLSINLPGYEGNSIAAQSLNLNKKARIVYVQKEIGIEFKLPFDRTWSAISRAIEKTDYEVVDTNRELKYIQIKAKNSNRNFFQNLINPIIQDEAEADYELIFSDSSGDTLLEFKKLSQTEVSVDELVDNINESLS